MSRDSIALLSGVFLFAVIALPIAKMVNLASSIAGQL